METRFGFTSYSISEFETWVSSVSIARNVSFIQQHHTWLPNYSGFTGSNHFEMQKSMKNYHVANNGWSDIGQNFSIFPDGRILSGRPINKAPACIFGNNAGAICFESIGDFDSGKDSMTSAQKQSILRSCAAILKRIPTIKRNEFGIVYHHWFDLSSGARTNGAGSTKSCPGTAFFGGNTVSAFKANFLPQVLSLLGGPSPAGPGEQAPLTQMIAYVVVTADFVNIRTGPNYQSQKVDGDNQAELGSILRVWDEQGGWLKISSSKSHWVSGRHVARVRAGTINTDDTNCRIGPGASFGSLQKFQKGDVVYVQEERGDWSRIGVDRWVKGSLITLE